MEAFPLFFGTDQYGAVMGGINPVPVIFFIAAMSHPTIVKK